MIPCRTPEGEPLRCWLCGHDVCIDPSSTPIRDAPCPHCGCLLRLDGLPSEELVLPAQALGHFDSAAIDELPVPRRIVLDFAGVKSLDSALLERLMAFRKKCGVARVILVDVAPFVRDVLRVTRLDKLFEVQRA